MDNLENLISHVIHPQFRPSVGAGHYFDPEKMCEHCRRKAWGSDIPSYSGNVISLFARCTRQPGCVVCGFCGFAMLELMAEGASRHVVPDCPKCGAVVYISGAHFASVGDRDEDAEGTFLDWHRRMRCLDLFALATGLAAFAALEAGSPLNEEDCRELFYSVLTVTGLLEDDECVNRFFDRMQDAIRFADSSPASLHECPQE